MKTYHTYFEAVHQNLNYNSIRKKKKKSIYDHILNIGVIRTIKLSVTDENNVSKKQKQKQKSSVNRHKKKRLITIREER